MRKGYVIALIGLWSIGHAVAQGGGWTSGQFRGFFKIEERVLFAEDFYDNEGNIVEIPSTGLLTTSVYGQFGILDRLDVMAYVPLFVFNYQDTPVQEVGTTDHNEGTVEDNTSGIGNIQVGIKYGIIRNTPLVVSVGVAVEFPKNKQGDAGLNLQTGDEDFKQWLHADVGLSLWPVPAYLAAGLAFNNRNNSFSDQVNWYLSGGISFLEVLSAKAEIAGLYSLDNGDAINLDRLYSTFLNDRAYLAYGGEVTWEFVPKLGFSIGADLAAGGQNILAGPTIFGSFHLKL